MSAIGNRDPIMGGSAWTMDATRGESWLAVLNRPADLLSCLSDSGGKEA